MKLTMILLLESFLVFWNVENFFTPENCDNIGGCNWTANRFYTKARGIGKTILSISDTAGRLPDIIGLCEVDSKKSVLAIANSPVLKNKNYKVVHYDSPDHRGIDCALLYRGKAPLKTSSIPITINADTIRTRSLLKVEFDSLCVIVVHLPSKRGQDIKASHNRKRAMEMIDSIATFASTPMLVMGDFNDERSSQSDSIFTHLKEVPVEGKGSIKFLGKWEKIDRVLEKSCKVTALIASPAFLLTEDKTYGGTKPLRTNSGPRYLGGLSDHLPIIIQLR